MCGTLGSTCVRSGGPTHGVEGRVCVDLDGGLGSKHVACGDDGMQVLGTRGHGGTERGLVGRAVCG